MKKLICIICVSALLSGIILVNALTPKSEKETEGIQVQTDKTDNTQKKFQEITQPDIAQETVTPTPPTPALWKYFEQWVQLYRPSKEQQTQIRAMIQNGADEKTLIDICIFWEDTNEPFSIVEEIWNMCPKEEERNRFWIEDTFNSLTGKKQDELSTEEVREYIERGVSLSDIHIANRFSRQHGKFIRDILEQRLIGETWENIIIGSETNRIQTFSIEDKTEEYGGNDILDSVIIARNTGRTAYEVLSLAEKGADFTILNAYIDEMQVSEIESEANTQ